MPHVDELLGVTTVAAAGLFAAVMLQPLAGFTARGDINAPVPVATIASASLAAHGGSPASPQRAH